MAQWQSRAYEQPYMIARVLSEWLVLVRSIDAAKAWCTGVSCLKLLKLSQALLDLGAQFGVVGALRACIYGRTVGGG